MQNVFLNYLLCEYLENPMGVDSFHPRFSWMLSGNCPDIRQTAYHILVASCADILAGNIGDIWDSGEVKCSKSLARFDGVGLESAQRYFWKVRIALQDGKWSEFSEPAYFTAGILEQIEWKGEWLGFSGGANGSSMLARRQFALCKKPERACLFACGLGYMELRLNGRKIGDHLLDPVVSDYTKRVYYVSYDVTDYLRAGENVIGLIIGNGWHGAPRFIFQLYMFYADGSKEILSSGPDTGWNLARGPITENSIFDGEIYDARLEKDGWDTSGYGFASVDRVQGGWIHAMRLEPPCGRLVSQMLPPIRVQEVFSPNLLYCLPDGIRVYDVGRNIAGFAKISVSGQRGATVTMRFAENLYPDGHVNQENLRTALARDIYILRGSEREEYCPRFTYHGFRYLEVECGGDVTLEDIEVMHIRSDVRRTGRFECGNNLVNQIEHLVVNTESNNLHGIPTDCPQRDERMGWLNDATVRAEESIYHFDLLTFYEKWMIDISDTQGADGSITDTAPFRFGTRPADPVCTSFLLIPWLLYLHYGDIDCIETHYEAMKKWVGYLDSIAEDGIIRFSRFGDWASPRSESEDTAFGSGAVSATTPGSFMSTCYQYYNYQLMKRFAILLGNQEDENYYISRSDYLCGRIIEVFFNEETGKFAKGSQGSQAFALFLNLAPEEYHNNVLEVLLDEVKRHNGHLSTGNQTTKYLLETLSFEGHGKTALDIVTQSEYPGWGYMIENGATTVWERWEYDTSKEMNSHDHPMHGALASWFYSYLAGIRPNTDKPGFEAVEFWPASIPEIRYAKCSLETCRGTVSMKWEILDGPILIDIVIPANSEGILYLREVDGFKLRNSDEVNPKSDDSGIMWGKSQNGYFVVGLQNGCHRLVWGATSEREG